MESMTSAEEMDRTINDPAEWDTPKPGRKSEKRQRGVVVSVRMTEAELETVQENAARAGQTVGAFMRESALSANVAEDRTNVHAAQATTPARTESPSVNVIAEYVSQLPHGTGRDIVVTA